MLQILRAPAEADAIGILDEADASAGIRASEVHRGRQISCGGAISDGEVHGWDEVEVAGVPCPQMIHH